MTDENINSQSVNQNSLVSKHQYAVNVTTNLRQILIIRYRACPIFVKGLLKDGFKAAFRSKTFKKPRPLLIYIHHDNNPVTDKFCSDLFCSEYLIEFLNENYIVWAWDITKPCNQSKFEKMWKEIFPEEELIGFSIDECPMLIGVMRIPSTDDNSSSPPLYKFETILNEDHSFDLQGLLYELIAFKERFDDNDEQLPFSFVKESGLSWELCLELAEFLSLNDSMTVLSPAILPLLSKANRNLPIINPTNRFMKNMLKEIESEQVVALHVGANRFKHTMKLDSSKRFSNVKSLTLSDLVKINQIYDMRNYLPNLTCLTVCYKQQIDFHTLCKIFNQLPKSVTKFIVNCDFIPCSHSRLELLYRGIYDFNTSVQSLVLNIDHTQTSLVNNCIQNYNNCILRTICDFIRIMSKIRYIWIIVNTGNIKTLLDVNEWRSLVERCLVLEKITLKVKTNISNDPQLTQKIEEIKNQLHNQRESVQLLVKVK